jgi:hypothetical protein
MLIERGLNLGQLLYLMPDEASYAEADCLRSRLLRDHLGERTEAISRTVWDDLVSECMPHVDGAAVVRR